jgi:hypothetical protein
VIRQCGSSNLQGHQHSASAEQLLWKLPRARPGLPPASCGAVALASGNTELSAGNGQDQRALRCFVTAIAACKAASIDVRFVNVDTGTDSVYAIDPGGTPAHCTVSDQSASFNNGSTGAAQATHCRAASASPASAIITCSGQQHLVLLTANPSYTLPRASCGSAAVLFLSDGTEWLRAGRGVLTCFTTAARACKPAGLQLASTGADWGNYWVFVIAGGGAPGRCTVTEYSQYSAPDLGGLSSRSPNGWAYTPVETTPCQEASVTSKGVALDCSTVPVHIPIRSTS